jgi:outer membrane protein assembly factor BamB
VLAEDRLYCLAEDGSTTVIAAGREFKQLAKNRLEGPCKASPAISGGRIFIRSQNSLFCIRGSPDEGPRSRGVGLPPRRAGELQ